MLLLIDMLVKCIYMKYQYLDLNRNGDISLFLHINLTSHSHQIMENLHSALLILSYLLIWVCLFSNDSRLPPPLVRPRRIRRKHNEEEETEENEKVL